MDLTDAQWAVIEPLIPKPRRRKDGRGRLWRKPRDVLGGILCAENFLGFVHLGCIRILPRHL